MVAGRRIILILAVPVSRSVVGFDSNFIEVGPSVILLPSMC